MKTLYLTLILILAACNSPQPIQLIGQPRLEVRQETVKKEPLPASMFEAFNKHRSVINKGDLLEVSVFGQDNTTAQVKIAPDGKLYYLFDITVIADGKFIEDISMEIKEKLRKMFNNPEVSVLPVMVRDNRFSLIGKVRAPGQYSLVSSLTLRQAISEAGGLRDGVFRGTTIKIASLKESFIIRNKKKIPVDFHALLEKGDTSQNIYVHPGDYIYIASGLAREVYILGAVTAVHPAAYNDNMTLVSLLSEQGRGFTPKAYLKQVIILRGDLEKPLTYQVNLEDILAGKSLDIYLQPGDIVYVPEKPYQFIRELTHLALNVFAASIGGRAGRNVSNSLFPGDQ
jgi:protein involved in polysaccharide export with SLBB domain